MVTVQLYVEGGGTKHKNSSSANSQCREGFTKFLEKAGLKGRMPGITACGPGSEAFDAFKRAMKNRSIDELPILLIDSEGPVSPNATAWQHLAKVGEKWRKPEDATEDQAFLMV